MRRGFRALARIGLVGGIAIALVGVIDVSPSSAAAEDAATQAFRTSFQNDATVTLTGNVTLTCDGGGVAIRNDAAGVTINGGGFMIQQTCAGNAVLQNVNASSHMTLNNVTLTGGTNGGVVASDGVDLDHSPVTNNSGGGSIESSGTVQLFHSSITNGTYAIEASGSI